jgi:hypothetical protein
MSLETAGAALFHLGACMMQQEELNELARRCQQENDTFRRTGSSDPSYCLQLFHLALVEGQEDAVDKIVECYTPDLRNRFFAHPWATILREYQDDVLMMTFERFLERNEKELLQITSLGALLNYLHRCFYTAILLCKRDKDKQRLIIGTLDDFAGISRQDSTDESLDKLAARDVWLRIAGCVDNSLEERVMHLWLVQDYSAPEIVQCLPANNLTREKVYQIVEKVFRRYRKHYPRTIDT